MDNELEASVRIAEALLAKVPESQLHLELRVDFQSTGTVVGERVGELFKAIYAAVRDRDVPGA